MLFNSVEKLFESIFVMNGKFIIFII